MTSSSPLDFEQPIAELDGLIAELKQLAQDPAADAEARGRGMDITAEIAKVEALRQNKLRQIFRNLTPWNEVQIARHTDRPYTLDYIRLLFTDFMELHGDRINSDDPAIVGGLAYFEGRPVVVLGHQKGRDLKERQYRNFGSPRPAGFRKALRLMKLAEKFRRPLIVFVDTPAAEANLRAEEDGVSRAIAVNLFEMSTLRTPIVVAVIGEGGSGGALALALGDRTVMLEHAIYSVIPPESCAAILFNDRSRAPEAAVALKLTAQDALSLGLVDEVLPEPLGGAHRDNAATASTLGAAISTQLAALCGIGIDALVVRRYERFRRMGQWDDPSAVDSLVKVP